MFSKACTYGIRAVLYLAIHATEHQKLGAKPIADALEVPAPFLAKVLQELARKGIISSQKGPGGGFYLAPRDYQVSIAQIVEAIDGPHVFTACVLGLSFCSSANPCPLHVQAFAYREGLKYQLMHHTVEEMARRIERDQIRL
ncbi:MAG: Rrf2 family transcriptional regulator [Bacteroidia bacterium]